jgi:multidrug resistance efflux pump
MCRSPPSTPAARCVRGCGCERAAACRRAAGGAAVGRARTPRAQAQANLTKADADLARYKPLVEKDVISKQQWDAAVAADDGAKAALANAQAAEHAAGDGVRAARDRETQAQAQHNAAETGPQQVEVQNARAKAGRRRWSRRRRNSTRPSST